MTTYISLFIAFLATLIAIRGNTWDDNARGWSKITIYGWITATLALSGFISVTITTYNSNKESTKIKKMIKDFNIPSLTADWKVDNNNLDLIIGNDARFTLIVEEISVNWLFKPIQDEKIEDFLKRRSGIPIKSNLLRLNLTPNEAKKTIVTGMQKFSPGDVERWQTNIDFASKGEYTVWASILYRTINQNGHLVFETNRKKLYYNDNLNISKQ